MKQWRVARRDGSVGFVPTMGYLHKGHLSLVEAARAANEHVVVSIYVNPTQFGPAEDFAAYPRDLARDSAMLRSAGVDALFAPTDEEMYPDGYATTVRVEGTLTAGLCGASRPGHFAGVTTVVTKLFNIVRPTRAYFGEKDAQQLAVIRRMTVDENLDVDIIGCPTVREPDGLAMSSRNAYLSPTERISALSLVRALDLADSLIQDGERDVATLRKRLLGHFESVEKARVDYVEFVDAGTLVPVERVHGRTLLALAVYIGRTRLIDNRTFVTDA
jgi:pantoate--beta-alanine ligase